MFSISWHMLEYAIKKNKRLENIYKEVENKQTNRAVMTSLNKQTMMMI